MKETHKATLEQIADWKSKYGEVYELKAIGKDGAISYGYISTKEMLKAQDIYYKMAGLNVTVEGKEENTKKTMNLGTQNRGFQSMLKIIFIGGDESIITDFHKFSSIKKFLSKLIETSEGEMTKL